MHDTPRAPITVSIVSHGQQALLLPLLEQLEAHCAASIDRIVLTINVPEAELVATRHWRFAIDRIANSHPRGFGANHNAAFARCQSDWFLILNPDIRLDTDALRLLREQALDTDGLLAPRILERSPTQPEPHRALLTPWEILTRKRSGYRAPTQPAWVAGMFMLLRTQAFRQVHGFDERYFMYGEDFDLCARLRLAGWQIRIGESVHVRHEARRASRTEWRHLAWHLTSLARVWLSPAFWRYRALWNRSTEPAPGHR